MIPRQQEHDRQYNQQDDRSVTSEHRRLQQKWKKKRHFHSVTRSFTENKLAPFFAIIGNVNAPRSDQKAVFALEDAVILFNNTNVKIQIGDSRSTIITVSK
ncbi:hypothetical protein EVAR_61575_1 [Eumeta japonica]|uniref:Uncharacterized protein n=1 Tax=Eumeta variegata TaxID=151549 RepID=A0A4C1YUN5_EUMVA|nr:hypothetical protein EVAR_61575_1 [Eumeta japonica]